MLPVPKIEDRPFKKPLFCGPGPCDVWPSVQEAYSKPVLSPKCDEYYNVCEDIRTGFQYIFQTSSKLVLALSGSGHAGMEAIITNLVQPGETMLIAARGMWDERALEITKRHGIKAAIARVPMNTTFELDQIERELKKVRPQALFITHGDSSTGTVQSLKGLGDLCHKYGTLLLVDTVVSLVAEPFFMDRWGVDAVYTSTQKALSGPAGISAVAFSSHAELKMNSNTHDPPFYLDIKLLAQQWNCYGNTRLYHHTLSPPMLWALHACIKEVCKETLPTAWARHATTIAHFNRRLEQLSFKLMVPKPQDRLSTVTTVVLPKGYDYNEFSQKMRATHNILIFPGLGPTVGMALRIGLMGVNSTTEIADQVADAMGDTLRTLMRKSFV